MIRKCIVRKVCMPNKKSPYYGLKVIAKVKVHNRQTGQQEPQGALIAHLSTMNTSV